MDLITVYFSDDSVGQFSSGELNLNREQLIITLKYGDGIAGWHWDHWACILQYACQPIQPPPIKDCRFCLSFSAGQRKELTIDEFHAVESAMANSIMIFRGARQTALVNRDFLSWYRITIGEGLPIARGGEQ